MTAAIAKTAFPGYTTALLRERVANWPECGHSETLSIMRSEIARREAEAASPSPTLAWKAETDRFDVWVIYASDGRAICDFNESDIMDEEAEAYARLIAAAPEMLEALKAVADATAGTGPVDTDRVTRMNAAFSAARAAVAKAEASQE